MATMDEDMTAEEFDRRFDLGLPVVVNDPRQADGPYRLHVFTDITAAAQGPSTYGARLMTSTSTPAMAE